MHRISIFGAAALVCLALAPPSLAATYVIPPDEMLIDKADLIVRGRVVSVVPTEDPDGSIHTEITIEVARALKGARPGRTVTIRQPGGAVGERIEVYPGIGSFAPGEDVLVMLDAISGSRYRLTDYALGKFHVARGADGGEYLRRDGLGEANILRPGTEGSAAPGVTDPDREAEAFERFIVDVSGGLRSDADYVVSPGISYADEPFDVHAEFTFLSAPPARWIEFETGGTITFKDHPRGDRGVNCPTGCHGEVAGGLNAWNFAPGAKIAVAYGGLDDTIRRKCLGQLNNQIQFGDPDRCDEMPSLSGCAGTLALGGYSGYATGGGNRCPQIGGGMDFGQIIAGRVMVNNDVGSCLDSCDYRDMIAHETGHMVGAGHSSVPGALMGPFLGSGRCGALQSDDAAFAACAYAGTATPCNPPVITQAYARRSDRIWRAVVLGTGFQKGDRVEIDAGSGFVAPKKTAFKSSTKIVGKNVTAIWPKGVPVQVRVVTPLGCVSNTVGAIR